MNCSRPIENRPKNKTDLSNRLKRAYSDFLEADEMFTAKNSKGPTSRKQII